VNRTHHWYTVKIVVEVRYEKEHENSIFRHGGSVNPYQPLPTQNTINHTTHNFHYNPNKSYRKIDSRHILRISSTEKINVSLYKV